MGDRVKLNLHVPANVHRRLKLLAAMKGITMQKLAEAALARLTRKVVKDGRAA